MLWKAVLLAVLTATVSAVSQAEIYKCLDEYDRPQFADKPCEKNAATIEVAVPENTGVELGSTGDFSTITKDNKKRDMDRRIEALEDRLADLDSNYSDRIAALDKRYNSLLGNKRAGQARADIRAEQRQIRNEYYSTRDRERRRLWSLRQDRSAIR